MKEMLPIMSENLDSYWNSYYSSSSKTKSSSPPKLIPSQFAAFVLSEFSDRNRFIDIGCGNGRDTFFFADHGKQALGVDGSSSAIENANRLVALSNADNISFKELDISSKASCDKFINHMHEDWQGAVIYARFFLHAINDDVEDNLLKICQSIIGSEGRICFEFRTDKDEYQVKETASHYRRFINPLKLIEKLSRLNLNVSFFAEGFGFAKYKDDNAYVARMIIQAS